MRRTKGMKEEAFRLNRLILEAGYGGPEYHLLKAFGLRFTLSASGIVDVEGDTTPLKRFLRTFAEERERVAKEAPWTAASWTGWVYAAIREGQIPDWGELYAKAMIYEKALSRERAKEDNSDEALRQELRL